MKGLSDQRLIRNQCLKLIKNNYFQLWFLDAEMTSTFPLQENINELKTFKPRKTTISDF